MVDKLSDKQIYEYLKVVNEQVYDCIVDEDINALNGIIEGVETSGIMDLPNYNDAVKSYNSLIIKFPNNILASMFKFEKAEYFKADEGKTEVPDVEF